MAGPRARLGWLLGGVLAAILIPWFLWGERIEAFLSPEAMAAWAAERPRWLVWLAGIALLMADVLLPVPATPVMSALGFVLGPWEGGLISALGVFLAGCLAYGLARVLGRGMAERLAGAEALGSLESRFAADGGWMVALSRWTPVLPEAVACLAGLSRLPFARFAVALACGCLPLGLAFAWIGHLGQASPALAFILSAAIPGLLWWSIARRLRGVSGPSRPRSSSA